MAVREVVETNIGMYIGMSNGYPIDDGDGHVLAKHAKKGNRNAIRALIQTAEAYGYENVTVKFIPGVRPVTDEEYIVQQQRLAAGLTPDVNELGTAIDLWKEGVRARNG